MKITSPINNYNEVFDLIKYGADIFYGGLSEEIILNKNKQYPKYAISCRQQGLQFQFNK